MMKYNNEIQYSSGPNVSKSYIFNNGSPNGSFGLSPDCLMNLSLCIIRCSLTAKLLGLLLKNSFSILVFTFLLKSGLSHVIFLFRLFFKLGLPLFFPMGLSGFNT